jgi:hypothetical protein
VGPIDGNCQQRHATLGDRPPGDVSVKRLESLDDLRVEAQNAGLADLADDELRFLKRYYDHAYAMNALLAEVDTSDAEPATVFKADAPS